MLTILDNLTLFEVKRVENGSEESIVIVAITLVKVRSGILLNLIRSKISFAALVSHSISILLHETSVP